MENPIQIVPVSDKRGLHRFIQFPFELYKGDPYWVPPFYLERKEFFDTRKNPFYEHAEYQLFLALRSGRIVGTVGAVIDENHNRQHNELMGAFGFFESIDDQDVADALLNTVREWILDRGMTLMRGPLNFSTNHECGLLVDGFRETPMVMTTYNPGYYPWLIENYGFRKAMDLYTYAGSLDQSQHDLPSKAFRVADRAARRHGISVRPISKKRFMEEMVRFKEFYNQTWRHQWGFVPMTEKEGVYLATNLKLLVDPRLVLIAENSAGTPIGISIALPDLHQAIKRSGGGALFPFGLLRFLWFRRQITQMRLMVMGVTDEYRNCGIDAIFWVETVRAGRALGYKRMEGSWVIETNTMMNRIGRVVSETVSRTHRIYDLSLN